MPNGGKPVDVKVTLELREAFIAAFGVDIGQDIDVVYEGGFKQISAGDDFFIFASPGLEATATNTGTGTSISFNATGPQKLTILDGTQEWVLAGHNSVFTLDENGDPAFYELIGRFEVSFNPDGSELEAVHGHGVMHNLLPELLL